MSSQKTQLYVVVIDTAAPTDSRLMTFDGAWQGQLSAEYIVTRFGYRGGMREFVETHGYAISAEQQEEFEASLNADDRIVMWWADEMTEEADIASMPWEV